MFTAQELIAQLSHLLLKEDDLRKLLDASSTLHSPEQNPRKSQTHLHLSAPRDKLTAIKEARKQLEREVKEVLGKIERDQGAERPKGVDAERVKEGLDGQERVLREAQREIEGQAVRIKALGTKIQKLRNKLGDFEIPETTRKLQREFDSLNRFIAQVEKDMAGIFQIIGQLDEYNNE